MELTAVEALQRYRDEAGPKPAAIVERWLRWLGTRPRSDRLFKEYLEGLQIRGNGTKGMATGTVDLHRRMIQAFYRHFGFPAPQVRNWRYDPRDASRPALGTDLVRHLITAARRGELTPRQTALLALSTTYGMRAEELASVQDADVDRVGERCYIRTIKGGVRRWFWLPPALHPYLPDAWPECSPNSVHQTWRNLTAAAGVTVPPRTAWHAIRRALVRSLRAAAVPDGYTGQFMRWARGGGSSGMESQVEHYAHPSDEVGVDGTATPARVEDAGRREFDQLVWERHPYLPLWSS